MDCFAPTLGHTAVRCADMSTAQARLLMLPATLYLLGSLVMAANWVRLALARRLFRFEHLLILSLNGLLAFSLAVADKTYTVSQSPYTSSRAIGGVSIVVTFFLVVSIFNFLPPRIAVPGWLERTLVATGCSTLVCMLLASIGKFTPDGLTYEDRNNRYAACASMLAFLLTSIIASQNARFFAIPTGVDGVYRTFASLGAISNALFVSAIAALIAQTCIALVLPPHFAHVIVASMLGALTYILLIATSITAHFQRPVRSITSEIEEARQRELTKRQDESFHVTGAGDICGGRETEDAEEANVVTRNGTSFAALGPLEANRNDGNDRPRTASNAFPGSETGSVIWHGGAASRAHLQSGVSAASWDRLESIMRARREHAKQCCGTRPQSGMSYYGSEASYAEGLATRRSSMLSSAGLAAAMGMGVPPVPAIHPKYLHANKSFGALPNSEGDVPYAKPLTPGEEPIPLSACEAGPQASAAVTIASPRGRLNGLTGFFWNSNGSSENKSGKGSGPSSGPGPALVPPLKFRNKFTGTVDSACRSSNSTLVHKPSVDGSQVSLAARYTSSKLFPSPMCSDGQASVTALQTSSEPGQQSTTEEKKYYDRGPPISAHSLPNELGPALWSETDGGSARETSQFASLQDRLMYPPDHNTVSFPSSPSSRAVRKRSERNSSVDYPPPMPTHEEEGSMSMSGSMQSIIASPRLLVQKETQKGMQQDEAATVLPLPDLNAAQPETKPLSPTKVNRGKVVYKADCEEEDESTRMTSALRFANAPR